MDQSPRLPRKLSTGTQGSWNLCASANMINQDEVLTGGGVMIVTLECPKCSASLDIAEGVTRLKCRFCGSSLELQGSESAQMLTILQDGVDKISSGVEQIGKHVEAFAHHSGVLTSSRDAAHERWMIAVKQARKSAMRMLILASALAFGAVSVIPIMLLTLWALEEIFDSRSANTFPMVWVSAIVLFALFAATASEASRRAKRLREEVADLKKREPF